MAYEERFADVLSAVDLAIQAPMGSARPLYRIRSDPDQHKSRQRNLC